MDSYRLRENGMIARSDGVVIPPDDLNADYQRYLADVAAGAEVAAEDGGDDDR